MRVSGCEEMMYKCRHISVLLISIKYQLWGLTAKYYIVDNEVTYPMVVPVFYVSTGGEICESINHFNVVQYCGPGVPQT